MATVRAAVKIRDAAAVTSGELVNTFNTIHSLVASSGMIQVADDEFLGQSKLYSTADGAGLTQITVSSASFSEQVVGYKVYRHPQLGVYIKIIDMYVVQASGPRIYAKIKYELSGGLNGLGGFDSGKSSGVLEPLSMKPGTTAILPHSSDYSSEVVTVSCASDHFWISRLGGVRTTKNDSSSLLPPFLDWLGIGVFSSQSDNSVLCCILPQEVSGTSAEGLLGAIPNGNNNKSCLRYYVYANNFWTRLKNGAAGNLSNASVTSTTDGIRVAQAELVINGLYQRFNFGFVNAVTLGPSEIVDINLTGVVGRYQSVPNLGFADHAANGSSASDNSSVMLPISS